MNVYFDNAATTPVDPLVAEEIFKYQREYFGNASSIHYFGKKSKVILEESREYIADFVGCKPKELFFTSGGTESINTVIKGLFFEQKKEKNHIVTTSIEHPAVLESVNFLKNYFDVKVDLIRPNSKGEIDIEEIKQRTGSNTFLVSLMHSNNETGIINEIEKLSEFTKEKNIPFLSDTVQSIGKVDLKYTELGADFITSSAHKIYGPKGIGFLVANPKFRFARYSDGGGQERELRAGTENIPSIAGFRKAIEILKLNSEKEQEHYNNIRKYLIESLQKNFGDGITINFQSKRNLPNILNVTFSYAKYGFDPDMFLILLDMQGIAVSGGSACSSGSLKPSKILIETGKSEKEALSSVRISIGRFNSKEDVDFLVNGIRTVLRLN